jgi:outer membrane protein assembly factor BamB
MRSSIHSFRNYPLSTTLAFSLLGAVLAAGSDWPGFRGANRDDACTETGLLKDWPAGGPPLVWKAAGLGDGYSTVCLEGQRIYTAGEKGEESFVIALDAAEGKQLWSAKLGKSGPVGNPQFEGPRSTPTVEGELVFQLGQWGDLICVESATGKERWRKDLMKDFGGVRPNWGYSESPMVDGEKVLVTAGGTEGAVVALNKKTGTVIWRSKEFTDSPHYSSMIIAEPGGIRQYIQLTAVSLAGIAAADGKLLWRAPRKGATAVIPTPIYDNGVVYVSSGYGAGCNLFKISATDGKFGAEEVYANKVMVNHHGGVVKVGNFLYGYSDGKGWTCQDFKTGEAKWQDKEKLGKGSLVYADGRLYLREEDKKGTVALIEPSPDGFKEHGRFDPPNRSGKKSWAHPVVAGGRLYLRDMDVLLCYNVK